MSKLQWFKWYPADAEMDENFRSMSDADIGYYIRCLNHSWINGSIPADSKQRARALGVQPHYDKTRWGRVGPCWVLSSQDKNRMVNRRQEFEKEDARKKSLKAAESVKARYDRNTTVPTNVERTYIERTTNDLLLETETEVEGRIETHTKFSGTTQAAPENPGVRSPEIQQQKSPETLQQKVTQKVSAFSPVIEIQRRKEPATSERFQEWLSAWPSCADPNGACRMWISRVTPENESAAFACRDRYLSSDQAKRGILQAQKTFIEVQADCNWTGTWISDTTQLDPSIAGLKDIERRIKEMDEHDQRNGRTQRGIQAKGFERISETARRSGIDPGRNGNSN